MNPIRYSDFFEQDGSLKELISQLQQVQSTFRSLRDEVAQTARQYQSGMSGMNPATDEGRQKVDELAKKVDELYREYQRLNSAIASVKSNEEALTRIQEQQIRTAQERRDATRAQTREVRAKMAAEKLDIQAVEQLTRAENLAAASYNKLADTYRLLKERINDMTAATKEEIAERQKLQQSAAAIYQQMNQLQQATGKFSLQVGNYAKSWNGLNIATQQIVRELPNATMGFGMFMLSISNNIPILTDQIALTKAHRQALLEEAAAAELAGDAEKARQLKMAAGPSVGRQMVKSIFSWQTLLVAGVTILTMYGKELGEWVKGLLTGKKALNEAAEAAKRFNAVYEGIASEAGGSVSKLDALYQITTDLTAAEDDRIAAAKGLQELYPETFKNYSTEEIMLGKLEGKYNDLRDAMMRTAMTQAAMNQLAAVDERILTAKVGMQGADRLAQANGYGSVHDMAVSIKNIAYNEKSGRFNKRRLGAALSALDNGEEIVTEWKKNNDELKSAIADREAIMKVIQDEDLFSFGTESGGRKGSQKETKVTELKDIVIDNSKYIRDARKAELDAMEDGKEKEIAITMDKYDTEITALNDFMDEQKDIRNRIAATYMTLEKATTQEQKNELTERLNNLYKNLKLSEAGEKAVKATIVDLEKKENMEIADINAKYRKKEYDAQVKMAGEQKKLADLRIKTANIEADDEEGKAQRQKELLENELSYWQTILSLQLKYNDGTAEANTQIKITEATIDNIMAQIGQLNPDGSGASKNGGKKFDPLAAWRGVATVLRTTIDSIGDIIEAYKEMAEAAEKAAEKQVEAAEKVYDAELEAYKNGYANNVEFARKEMAERRKRLREAQELTREYERIQIALDTAMQVSSLITASANLYKVLSPLNVPFPGAGVSLATALTATMFSAFAAAKVMAFKVAGNQSDVQYGEGGTEYMGYGGTHASGHDIDFGRTRDGRRRSVERGETVAVINARSTSKYGYATISGIVEALNRGVFDQVYSRAFDGADGMRQPVTVGYDSPYFKRMSGDLKAIRRNSERRTVAASDNVIVEQYKNVIRKKRLS